jgi:DNA mismatch repair ATPase MutS
MYPIRAIKKEWANLNKKIEAAQEELVHQRTNCLSTLQAQGEKQVTALDKIADTLSLMHLDQKETLGMLRKH